MRRVSATFVLPCVIACTAGAPPAPGVPIELSYSACGAMADLRSHLTGGPEPTAESDALLHRLGVRCIGEGEGAVRARY